jgi:uncharacterized membrane protein
MNLEIKSGYLLGNMVIFLLLVILVVVVVVLYLYGVYMDIIHQSGMREDMEMNERGEWEDIEE